MGGLVLGNHRPCVACTRVALMVSFSARNRVATATIAGRLAARHANKRVNLSSPGLFEAGDLLCLTMALPRLRLKLFCNGHRGQGLRFLDSRAARCFETTRSGIMLGLPRADRVNHVLGQDDESKVNTSSYGVHACRSRTLGPCSAKLVLEDTSLRLSLGVGCDLLERKGLPASGTGTCQLDGNRFRHNVITMNSKGRFAIGGNSGS